MPITMFYLPGSAAMAAMAALEETGAPYDAVRVVRKDGHTIEPANYREISPHQRVPAMVDGDVNVYESAAIVLHLADRFPASGLMPDVGSGDRSHAYSWLIYLTNTVKATFMWRLYPERVVGDDSPARTAVVTGTENQLDAMFDWIESRLESQPYLLGARFSAADLYLHMLTRWGRHLDRKAWTLPALGEHYRRLSERPSVARMLARQGIEAYPTE
jgi:glutathione S-transferase